MTLDERRQIVTRRRLCRRRRFRADQLDTLFRRRTRKLAALHGYVADLVQCHDGRYDLAESVDGHFREIIFGQLHQSPVDNRLGDRRTLDLPPFVVGHGVELVPQDETGQIQRLGFGPILRSTGSGGKQVADSGSGFRLIGGGFRCLIGGGLIFIVTAISSLSFRGIYVPKMG